MASVNPWLVFVIVLLLALALPASTALRGPIEHRLVAVQLAAIIASLLLVSLSIGFSQPSFLDLAVALVLLSLPGTLVLTTFLERWL
jgi:multisubunit Na+/H+ antiporter MnhF subunit